MVLVLGKEEPRMELVFRILSTPIARKWSELLAESLRKGGLRERERFANFNPDARAETDSLIAGLGTLCRKLAALQPEVSFGRLDFSDIQREVNRLHVIFADRHLVRHDLTEHTAGLWAELNCLLHSLEAAERRERIERSSGIRNAFVNVTFQDSPKVPLGPEDFYEGALYRGFGCCYLAYSQVGRSITELFYANDEEIPDAHVQPFDRMSADIRIWFGHNQGHVAAKELRRKLQHWFTHDWKDRFDRLGLAWDCEALGIPEIPVACLEEPVISDRRIIGLQERIFAHSYVADVKLL